MLTKARYKSHNLPSILIAGYRTSARIMRAKMKPVLEKNAIQLSYYFHLNNSAFWSMVGLRGLWEVQKCSALKHTFKCGLKAID